MGDDSRHHQTTGAHELEELLRKYLSWTQVRSSVLSHQAVGTFHASALHMLQGLAI